MIQRVLAFVVLMAPLVNAAPARSTRAHLKGLHYYQPLFWTQESVRTEKFLNDDVRKLLTVLFSLFPKEKLNINPFEGAKTCAIVGNSGNLRGSKYGVEIDAHDVVLRMNDAPVKGYQQDVGTKTTIVMTSAYRIPVLFSKDIHYISYCNHNPECMNTLKKFDDNKWMLNYKSLNMINGLFFYSLATYTKKKPSTGMAAVFMGLHYCQDVDLYGFGQDEKGEWDHYFKKEKWNARGTHNIKTEEDVLNTLEESRFLKIHRGKR